MNRRTFLATLGAVASQQNFGTVPQRYPAGLEDPVPPTFTVTRFPYVQNVRDDRASILWATFEPGFGQVRYTPDGVNYQYANATRRVYLRTETNLLANYYQYQVDLKGLTPNANYAYSALVDGQEIAAAGETKFRTAGDGPFKFIVLGDSGWGDPLSDAQALIAQRISAEKPALVIHTGDLVYPLGSFEYYQRNYFNYYAPTMCSTPFFPSPGNHDYDAPNATPYLAIHSLPTEGVPPGDAGRYYSFDWGNVHFVSIDAHQSLNRAVNAGGPMLKWLENDLRTTRQFWRIVYFHYPPFATGNNVGDKESTWVRTYMVPLFDAYGVQLVFSGHEHSYQRSVPMRKSSFVGSAVGTNYVTSGGGGAILYPVPTLPIVAFARSAYHYLSVDVQGTKITIRSIRQDGVELDNYSIAALPVFSDDPKSPPVTLKPGPTAGATIRILGRSLAADEGFACGPTPPTDMSGTVVTINGIPIQLLYVSPTQIYGLIPVGLEGNLTVRVSTANGFVERAI